jgi:hypothetical protein
LNCWSSSIKNGVRNVLWYKWGVGWGAEPVDNFKTLPFYMTHRLCNRKTYTAFLLEPSVLPAQRVRDPYFTT